MDGNQKLSARQLADRLGTSVSRLTRTARELGMVVGEQGSRSEFTVQDAVQLQDALGVRRPVPGLTHTEAQALSALSRSPRGLPSARALATRAGLSPTAAAQAVRSLMGKGLVREQETILPGRHARPGRLLYANREAPNWIGIAKQLSAIRLPLGTGTLNDRPVRDQRVPDRLMHLFWNTAPSQLDVSSSGPYIARRLISSGDWDGLTWGAAHLRAADWTSAAQARGLDAPTRALARNLARAAR